MRDFRHTDEPFVYQRSLAQIEEIARQQGFDFVYTIDRNQPGGARLARELDL